MGLKEKKSVAGTETQIIKLQIIRARRLLAKDIGGTSDPYVAIKLEDGVSKQQRKTKTIPKTLNPVWNETFEFACNKSLIASSDFRLRAWDKDFIGKDFLGEINIPVSSVHSPFETAPEQWIPLMDKDGTVPKNDMGEILIKIGFSDLEDNWTMIERKSSLYRNLPTNSDEFPNLSLDDLRMSQGVLIIQVKGVKDLPGDSKLLSRKKSCDSFLVVSLGTNIYRTRVFHNSLNPIWDEQFVFIITSKEMGYQIKFSVFDYEPITSSNLVGSITCPITTFIQQKHENLELKLTLQVQDGLDRTILTLSSEYQTIQELKKRFWTLYTDMFDENSNQTIDRNEFQAMLEFFEAAITQQKVDEIYEKEGVDELKMDDIVRVVDELIEESSKEGPEGRLFWLERCPFGDEPLPDNDKDAFLHIILHFSEEFHKMDHFVLGGFVTESFAKRGWVDRMVIRTTRGKYDLDANNANIFVQNRKTGQLEEEKMPTYIRLGIRLLYQSKLNKAQKFGLKGSITNIYYSLSVKQGKKMNDPSSVKSIMPFIKFHKLKIEEILEPLDSFKNFNEFFYRKLKPNARRIASEDPNTILSAADSRTMVFPTFDEATKLWIKGKNFSIPGLLQDDELAKKFDGGSLVIFRLAPQDYHRYHSPVTGVIISIKDVDGYLYTVNPMAIREEAIDVYTENKRVIVTIESDNFGVVAIAIIGAMMVGSIILSIEEGQHISRFDELGYFAFGGSTLVCLFQKDQIVYDSDLRENSQKQLETLVQVGDTIGKREEQ